MTDTTPQPRARAGRTPRWRLAVFWTLLAVLLFLRFGQVPEMLIFPVTAFGDVVGELATHEMHMFAMGFGAWVTVAAVLVQVRRPASQVAAAWIYTLPTVLTFGLAVALADLPAEAIPILVAAIGVAVLAFVAHPSSLRAKVTPVARPSVALLALAALAAIPLLAYAAGQLGIHLASGPGDEHWEFGHWLGMAVFATMPVAFGLLAAAKVSGWRFALWAAGLQVAALGVASLGISAVSQLPAPWALLAILWGAAFIAAGELETRRSARSAAPGRSAAAAEQTVPHRTDG